MAMEFEKIGTASQKILITSMIKTFPKIVDIFDEVVVFNNTFKTLATEEMEYKDIDFKVTDTLTNYDAISFSLSDSDKYVVPMDTNGFIKWLIINDLHHCFVKEKLDIVGKIIRIYNIDKLLKEI